MKRVVLAAGRERSVLNRHPWIFSGAIASGEAVSGETVEVRSARGETLGYGSYSPSSQIRVRMLAFGRDTIPDADFVTALVTDSVLRRADFFAPGATTNACRVINAESDGLPGVVADFYAGFVICQLSSAGAEYWKGTIAAALMRSVPGCRGVSVRNDLKDREKEGLPVDPRFDVVLGESPPEAVEISEGPCRFAVDVRQGHKTGFYLDQRDARALVGSLSRGRTVLNCFSYTGGFGLFARACGAKQVTQVDISEEAIESAKRNESLCGDSSTVTEYVVADVFEYLRKCRDAGKTFDLIVLDPPKFASVKHQVMKAARGYKDINLLAMKLLAPGGILATFSCSGAMTAELFDKIVFEAAVDAGRDLQLIARTRQGADHPVAVSFPEGGYLKGVVLRSLK